MAKGQGRGRMSDGIKGIFRYHALKTIRRTLYSMRVEIGSQCSLMQEEIWEEQSNLAMSRTVASNTVCRGDSRVLGRPIIRELQLSIMVQIKACTIEVKIGIEMVLRRLSSK